MNAATLGRLFARRSRSWPRRRAAEAPYEPHHRPQPSDDTNRHMPSLSGAGSPVSYVISTGHPRNWQDLSKGAIAPTENARGLVCRLCTYAT